VHVAHARQGIATRAVRALTDAAFGLSWVAHVEIHHDEANVASGAIPARLGFRRVDGALRERSAPAEVGREVRWRIDAETFLAARELPWDSQLWEFAN
jgi:ribosomal-protein-serine acetyltransferase